MPSLKKIVVQNFRNIELQELEFSGKLNCFTGGNGEGKTNLLDAIWYLSMTKSAFTADRFNFRYGSDFFRPFRHLFHSVQTGHPHKYSCGWR
ncbi:MAG: AAA family ATPase [Candidatus Cryptobacteroides sp.]